MKPYNDIHVVNRHLRATESRWKRLRLVQVCCICGTVICGLNLLLAGLVLLGWVRTRQGAIDSLLLLLVSGGIGTLISVMRVSQSMLKRTLLADAVERTRPELEDRLHTLVYLDTDRGSEAMLPFLERIAEQTRALLTRSEGPRPFPELRLAPHLGMASAAMLLTIWFHQTFLPWDRLASQPSLAASRRGPASPMPESPTNDPPPQLAEAITNQMEQREPTPPWGEVRINDPGVDLRVTATNPIALEIEVAVNTPLKESTWMTSVNGAPEVRHELAPSAERRYALYRPDLDLAALQLTNWDVVSYYAKAVTETSNTYTSPLYFVEIRPRPEEVDGLPGGGRDSKAFDFLNQLSWLIEQQRQVMRETHRELQNTPPDTSTPKQHKTVAETEAELSRVSRALGADILTEYPEAILTEPLQELGEAGHSLGDAYQKLNQGAVPEAFDLEQKALKELSAARHLFKETMVRNQASLNRAHQDNPPPDRSAERLQHIAEFRNETQAAQEFLRDLTTKERGMVRRPTTNSTVQKPQLAEEQQALKKSLDDFIQQHPRPFETSTQDCRNAQAAMDKAQQSLASNPRLATGDVLKAADQLTKLGRALADRSAEKQVQNAYQLKKVLEEQMKMLGQCQRLPNSVTDQKLGECIGNSRQALDQLQQIAGQSGMGDQFGPVLREALGGEPMRQAGEALQSLQVASNPQTKSRAAGDAKKALNEIVGPFESSEPKGIQQARQSNTLKGSAEERRERGNPENTRNPETMTSIDPSRLPPAYRRRIQKYFEKLSEK